MNVDAELSLNGLLRFANLGSVPDQGAPYLLSVAPVDADPPCIDP
jgi:hypothetical protein